jgi:methyl-accepting chemotaxis protein
MMHNISLVNKFIILVTVIILGFIMTGIASFWALAELKVNGPLYQRIVQGKDLVADILPPPEYIIESYLVALELRDAESPKLRDEGIVRLAALRKDYDARHEFWLGESLEPELKKIFLNEADGFAKIFYKQLNEQYLPAVQSADKERMKRVMQELKAVYEQHRQAIDQVVVVTNARNAADEKFANELIKKATGIRQGNRQQLT